MRSRTRAALAALCPIPLAVFFACSTTHDDDTSAAPLVDSTAANASPTPAASPEVTDARVVDAGPGGALCSDYNPKKNLYWGDLHTHTSLSVDANAWGTRNTPFDAYQFAMGKTKQIAAGVPEAGPSVALPVGRALDWDAVTDHSEWLATTYGCGELVDGGQFDPNSPYYHSAACVKYRALSQKGVKGALALGLALHDTQELFNDCAGHDGGTGQSGQCGDVTESAWQLEQAAAAAANLSCRFSTLVGYEWSATSKSGATLHHNVIFGTGVVPTTPFDFLDYPLNTDLWSALDNWKKTDSRCATPGACEAITIPHNSNESQGLAFDIPTLADGGLDPKGIDQMVRYQTLVEIHQHKGNSECAVDGGDDQCNFEQAGTGTDPRSYVRTGIGEGLEQYAAARDAGAADAANPLKLGFVGATDDHNGMPGNVAEDSWPGHTGDNDDTAAGRLATPDFNPGGITAVWAEQNTRDRIFAALERREVYATSGPRIAVRFYQVWTAGDYCHDGTFPDNVLAAGGVPMGQDMGPRPAGAVPQLVVSATKDVHDLAEVDIVKVSVGANGKATGTSSPRAIPAGGGCIQWSDPSFVASAPALYYARVLEKKSPRWSSYDCAQAPATRGCGVGGDLEKMIQERAWTSPIWFQP